jgi:hypothetical protein
VLYNLVFYIEIAMGWKRAVYMTIYVLLYAYIFPFHNNGMDYRSLPIIGITVLVTTTGVISTFANQPNNLAFANDSPRSSASSQYDCTEGSDGCDGTPYCDINDDGSCYNRHEGNDDGSSTDPEDPSFNGISNPEPPYYR